MTLPPAVGLVLSVVEDVSFPLTQGFPQSPALQFSEHGLNSTMGRSYRTAFLYLLFCTFFLLP